ncbi:MAG TPA: hypothetical protein VF163_23065 [Micromonosporaceae bacterium]
MTASGTGPLETASPWVWSDAWVLAAIMMTAGDEGAALSRVVAAADAINHAILMAEEVEPAVRRLLGVGLIAVLDRRYHLTGAGRILAEQCRGGMLDLVDDLLGRLALIPVREQVWSLEPGELDQAVREAAR